MKRDTLLELCEWLAPALRQRDTRMRPAIPLQKRVAIALWKLSTPDSYRSVGNQFGVGRSTVGAVLMQVVKAISRVLLRRVVRLADPDAVIRGFGALGFANCRGAIDGTHIPICAPEHQASQYVNRKGYFSILLQAMCDHWGQFTDINVGWSGKAHDARVYRNSFVCQKLQAGPSSLITTLGSGMWTCPCAWWGCGLPPYSPGS
uniref:DDE Tnp4 domain-containing protein n=1 Tax=Pelodiscus sinensis TaxID=13735 RepID=K7G4J0_PELSI